MAAEKAAQIAISKGLPPPKPPVTVRRRLLSWEESQRVLSRSNFKDKIANFDGRLLLDNDDLVAEVKNRIDFSTIKPEKSMAENLKPPVRSQPSSGCTVFASDSPAVSIITKIGYRIPQ